jgi:bla regulator protein blaR1
VTLLAALFLNGLHLVWRRRRWRVGTVAGVSVYFAPDVGPAVVGLLRPRVVIPDWLAEASPSRQTMVIAHEQSHLSAHDPQLLTVALFLLVLMPWNLPLWWQLHRLRRAIEVDCDARVLREGLDCSQYGETLIDVSQRPSGYIASVAAMSESRSFLEERITIMVSSPAKWGAVAAVVFGGLALALVAIATQVTPPNVGSSDIEQRPAVLTPAELDQYVGFYVRGANIVFSITRDNARLLLHFPGANPQEFVADSQMNFRPALGGFFGSPFTFVREAQGQVTGLLIHYAVSGTAFTVPLPRIDASAAQTIMVSNDVKLRSQAPTPGSEAALRRLLDGLRTRNPNYDEMAPWFAELVKETTALNEPYVRWGAVQSITFSQVDPFGGDTYTVRQEGGFSTWTIWLDSNGVIQDAQNYRMND